MSTVNNCPASNVPIPGPPASIGTFQYTTSSGGMVFFTYSAITEIADGNIWVDAWQQLPAFHFDNARLTDGSDIVMHGKAALIQQLANPGINAHSFRRQFGTYLHTLQDFYAHSNWVNAFPTNSTADLGNNTKIVAFVEK